MDFHIWCSFFVGTILICGSPGPNMLQVMASSACYGFRQSWAAMAGCFIPVFIYICISLAGVGTMLQAFPSLFDLLRYAGAVYLIYLGIGAWRTPVQDESTMPAPGAAPEKLFTRSFLVGISNPKAILFATAYFPQFLNPDAPKAIQFAILLGTFSVVEVSWYMIYAMGGSNFTVFLRQTKIRQRFNRIIGSLFMSFGVLMLAKR